MRIIVLQSLIILIQIVIVIFLFFSKNRFLDNVLVVSLILLSIIVWLLNLIKEAKK